MLLNVVGGSSEARPGVGGVRGYWGYVCESGIAVPILWAPWVPQGSCRASGGVGTRRGHGGSLQKEPRGWVVLNLMAPAAGRAMNLVVRM